MSPSLPCPEARSRPARRTEQRPATTPRRTSRGLLLRRALILSLAVLGHPREASAQTPRCDGLEPGARRAAAALLSKLHPYDCCDDTLARCLEAKPRCPLAVRLSDDVCRQLAEERRPDEIERGLSRRAQSMVATTTRAKFLLDASAAAGAPDAPVELVVYACARCPFCRELLPQLHDEVTRGALAGKVRLYLRPFPLKVHEHSTEAALAAIAAKQQGQLWPWLLFQYGRGEKFEPAMLPGWAKEAGLDFAAFETALGADVTRDALLESKKEGLRNRVTSTPTLFIDGRFYRYELRRDVLVDVLLEAYEARTANAASRPGP